MLRLNIVAVIDLGESDDSPPSSTPATSASPLATDNICDILTGIENLDLVIVESTDPILAADLRARLPPVISGPGTRDHARSSPGSSISATTTGPCGPTAAVSRKPGCA